MPATTRIGDHYPSAAPPWCLLPPTCCPAPADGRPGKREQCVEAAQQALDQGESVLIDRTNVTPVSVECGGFQLQCLGAWCFQCGALKWCFQLQGLELGVVLLVCRRDATKLLLRLECCWCRDACMAWQHVAFHAASAHRNSAGHSSRWHERRECRCARCNALASTVSER